MKARTLLALSAGSLAGLLLLPTHLISTQAKNAEPTAQTAITNVLTEQAAAWNRGDVNAFMKGYWNSPDLTFAGSGGITRGFQPVLERYRSNYPDQKAMGHLDFSQLEVHPLGNESAMVLGRWHLKRDSGEIGGVFTLVFRRFPDGWKIVHDHTSRDANAN
jgi:L-asparaginase / beta-aspartyl-peptidase